MYCVHGWIKYTLLIAIEREFRQISLDKSFLSPITFGMIMCDLENISPIRHFLTDILYDIT